MDQPEQFRWLYKDLVVDAEELTDAQTRSRLVVDAWTKPEQFRWKYDIALS